MTVLRDTVTTMVFFLGGCTYTEISALRWMAKQTKGRRFLIATTGIINGNTVSAAAVPRIALKSRRFWRVLGIDHPCRLNRDDTIYNPPSANILFVTPPSSSFCLREVRTPLKSRRSSTRCQLCVVDWRESAALTLLDMPSHQCFVQPLISAKAGCSVCDGSRANLTRYDPARLNLQDLCRTRCP